MQISIRLTHFLAVLTLVVVAVGLWFLIDRMIVTDHERVESLLDQVRLHAQTGNIDRLVDECLDPNFRLADFDREAFRVWATTAVGHYPMDRIRTYDTRVTVTGPTAHALVRTVVETGTIVGNVRMDWEADLVKHPPHDWRITVVRPFTFVGAERVEWRPTLLRYLE